MIRSFTCFLRSEIIVEESRGLPSEFPPNVEFMEETPRKFPRNDQKQQGFHLSWSSFALFINGNFEELSHSVNIKMRENGHCRFRFDFAIIQMWVRVFAGDSEAEETLRISVTSQTVMSHISELNNEGRSSLYSSTWEMLICDQLNQLLSNHFYGWFIDERQRNRSSHRWLLLNRNVEGKRKVDAFQLMTFITFTSKSIHVDTVSLEEFTSKMWYHLRFSTILLLFYRSCTPLWIQPNEKQTPISIISIMIHSHEKRISLFS